MPSFFVVAVDGGIVLPECGYVATYRDGPQSISPSIGGALVDESFFGVGIPQLMSEAEREVNAGIYKFMDTFDAEGSIPCGDERCFYCSQLVDDAGVAGNAFVTPAITTTGWSNTSVQDLFDSLADRVNKEAFGTVAIGSVEDFKPNEHPLGTSDAVSEDAVEMAALAAEVDQCSLEFFNALCDFDGALADTAHTSAQDIAGEYLDDAFSYLELAKSAFARAKRLILA